MKGKFMSKSIRQSHNESADMIENALRKFFTDCIFFNHPKVKIDTELLLMEKYLSEVIALAKEDVRLALKPRDVIVKIKPSKE
jgi:hypothetical protein